MTLFRNIWKRKNYRISLILAFAMVLWLASGLISSQPGDEASTSEDNDQLASVKARVIAAEEILLSVSMQAQTEPNREVDVRAEISGTVVDLPVEKGEFVEAGDVLCQLDLEDRQEILTQAGAALEKAEIDYKGAQRLQTGGFQSQSEIAQARATLEAARTSKRRAQLDLDNLQVRAPFDGFVNARPVELGDLVQRGETCAQVLDIDPILVTGRVSENAVAHISPGDSIDATLVTGEQVQGTVRFVERSADEVTRTFRVEALVPNSEFRLYSGISGHMSVPTGAVKAHRVNSSLLILNDSGDIGLKILDENNRVRLVIVELVSDDGSGIWVSGLPETATLITLGQQYAAEGDEVSVTLEETEAILGTVDQ